MCGRRRLVPEMTGGEEAESLSAGPVFDGFSLSVMLTPISSERTCDGKSVSFSVEFLLIPFPAAAAGVISFTSRFVCC